MAYQIVADGEVGDRREPRNDETPGQMISGREFGKPKRIVQGPTHWWVVPESP
jgi:hypothetical protein